MSEKEHIVIPVEYVPNCDRVQCRGDYKIYPSQLNLYGYLKNDNGYNK